MYQGTAFNCLVTIIFGKYLSLIDIGMYLWKYPFLGCTVCQLGRTFMNGALWGTRTMGGTPQSNFWELVGYWAVHKNFTKLIFGNTSKRRKF